MVILALAGLVVGALAISVWQAMSNVEDRIGAVQARGAVEATLTAVAAEPVPAAEADDY